MPTTPTPAFKLGETTDDPLQMYLADIFTVSAPLAGLPAISVPCGLTRDRLPIGLQLTGRAWDEQTLFRLGQAAESPLRLDKRNRRARCPPVHASTIAIERVDGSAVDFDLARPRLFAARQRDGQHAVRVGRPRRAPHRPTPAA